MKKAKMYLLFISFMFGILFTLGNPTIPYYTNALGIREGMVGFYFASTGLGLFVFATLWGALGDIKDRNKVLGIIFIGIAIGQFLFGLIQQEIIMLIAMLISGIFAAGVLVNIYSYVNDSFTEEHERDKTLSYVVSLYLLGFAFSYVIGGWLTDLVAPNYHIVFLIQGGIILSFGLFVYFEKTSLIDIDHHLSRKHFWMNIKQITKFPWVPIYTITLTFLISFSHNNVKRFIDFYIREEGYSATELGLLVFVVGIAGLLANMFIAPMILKRYHNFRFLQIQFIFVPIFLWFTFATKNTLFGMYTFYLGYSIMMALYEPTAISFMSSNRAVSQGVLVGARQSIVGLGMTIGFVVGGFLYERNSLFVFYLAIAFYIIVLVGFSILILLKKNEVRTYRLNVLQEEVTRD